jgi:hypothetical protein
MGGSMPHEFYLEAGLFFDQQFQNLQSLSGACRFIDESAMAINIFVG